MPRIHDQLQRSIIFIYPNSDSAAEGKGAGGTGFIVAVTAANGARFLYLITNAHVASMDTCHLRVPQVAGGATVVSLDHMMWTKHRDGDDVAAYRLQPQPEWDATAIEWNDLAATPSRLQELNIGVGDEIFMLGRFISHQGKQRAQPLARFGNISMMPGELVHDGRGYDVEAFLIEMRSLSGFSGSPVFVYVGPGT